MKKIFTLVISTILLSGIAHASENPHLLNIEYARAFDFIAPVVSSTTDVSDKETGLIIYDAGASTFKGYNHNGSWVSLGGIGPRSMIHVDSGNGFGATNTMIRRFSTTRTSTGSAITYADSSSNGSSFTINESGIYSIAYNDRNTGAGEQLCITVNASAMTTQCGTPVTYAQGTRCINGALINGLGQVSCTLILAAGDIVRPQSNGTANVTDNQATFIITKVSD